MAGKERSCVGEHKTQCTRMAQNEPVSGRRNTSPVGEPKQNAGTANIFFHAQLLPALPPHTHTHARLPLPGHWTVQLERFAGRMSKRGRRVRKEKDSGVLNRKTWATKWQGNESGRTLQTLKRKTARLGVKRDLRKL